MNDEKAETKTLSQDDKRGLFSVIKWVCATIIVLVLAFVFYKIYRLVTAPVAIIENTTENVSDVVKTGTESVKDGAANVYNRLVIPTTDQRKLTRLSEAAFDALNEMPETPPDGMKDRVFRKANLNGNAGKVCLLNLDFGNGAIPIHVAADNEAYETSKSLGADNDRLIRIVIRTEDDDVGFSTLWDEKADLWQMKWKATTIKKPVADSVAQARIFDILGAVKKSCDPS